MSKDRVVNGIALCFILVIGGFALTCWTFGLLYLWPVAHPFGPHPHSYLEPGLWAFCGLVAGTPFAGWTALVWHQLRRHRTGALRK